MFAGEGIMLTVELQFPILGPTLPAQHGYDLYAALCKVAPRLHEADCSWQVGPVFGVPAGSGLIQLVPQRSFVRLRLPSDDIPQALPLAGSRVRLGVPQVEALKPVPVLGAKLVVLKARCEPGIFLDTVRRHLAERGVRAEVGIPLTRQGPRAGQPRRSVLRLKGRRIVGYALLVQGLTADESLALQERGVGNRRRMGCGFFVPVRSGV
jgi:CRISPR-associated protein Cas6